MYTVSFYSFKGGVGRTMALANIGASLAQTGRKVLLVDFDLEAPGLSTYGFPKPPQETPGVVDFVHDYLVTNRAPKLDDYVYHSPGFGKEGGDLWVMPAGRQNSEYAARFAAIDWHDLYENRQGFLLMEDLKRQWENELGVDYVLLDSRTGHSDVVGICTRQLPDAVVLLMFPNIQNLIGLEKIVSDIRADESGPGGETQIHFVVSNVPDLDDENQILADTLSQFRERLGYERPSAIIHRYQSLSLLNQEIFTVSRPRTRLAQEYLELLVEIIKYNDEDQEGALKFLRSTLREARFRDPILRDGRSLGAAEIQERLDRIEKKHTENNEILYALAQVKDIKGDPESALELYQQALKQGFCAPSVFMSMARLQEMLDDKAGVVDSIRQALQLETISYFDLSFAAQVLSKIAPEELARIENSPALLSMDSPDQIEVAKHLGSLPEGFPIAEQIIKRVRGEAKGNQEKSDKIREESTQTLALGQIGQHRFSEAIEELLTEDVSDAPRNLGTAAHYFNLGMAQWGSSGHPNVDLFQRVVSVEDPRAHNDVNYLMCMAIAYFVLGDPKTATQRINRANRLITQRPKPTFSPWTYRKSSAKEIKQDIQHIQRMISGDEISPRIVRK